MEGTFLLFLLSLYFILKSLFQNIRFAAPPVGENRLKKPQPPVNETAVNDGAVGNQCPQHLPPEFSIANPFISLLIPQSEDCLFLDVAVPGKIVRGESTDPLPILNWIFGGGFGVCYLIFRLVINLFSHYLYSFWSKGFSV